MNNLLINQLLSNSGSGSSCNDCSKVQQFNNAQPNSNPCNPSVPSRQIPSNPVDQPVYNPEPAPYLPSTIPQPIAQQFNEPLPSDYNRWQLAGPLGTTYPVTQYPLPINNPLSPMPTMNNPYFTNQSYPSQNAEPCECMPSNQPYWNNSGSSALPQLLLMNQYAAP